MTVRNYLEYVANLMPSTETVFRLVSPDKLEWKPTEDSFTLGQQMAHIGGALAVYGRGITSGEWGFSTVRQRLVENRYTPSVSVDEAIATLQSNHELFKQLVGALSEEQFNNETVTAPQFPTPVPRWRVAMLGVEHHINHKAELFMSLKVLGVKVHTGHLYRGS